MQTMPKKENFFARLRDKYAETITVCAIGSWCMSAGMNALAYPGSASSALMLAADTPITTFLLWFLIFFAASFTISSCLPVAPYYLLASLLFYGTHLLYTAASIYFYLIILAVFAIAAAYAAGKINVHRDLQALFSPKFTVILIAAAGLIVFSYIIFLVLCRFFSYSSPCFDFGIFAQMFHNMRQTLLPMTTCERDGLLSHFAVHISPIYYLYLPFYALIPSSVTLLIMQTVFLFSGVVPLLLVAKKYRLSRPVMFVAACLYFAYPAMVGGTFYDMHENKLLLPLLLWLLWAIETEHYALTYPFAILVLLVKEDAPIYVAFVAIWWLFSRPRKHHALLQLVLSVLYFIFAVTMLEKFGDGAMFGRYSNLIGANGTPLDLIRTVLINPAMTLRELLDEEKVAFIAYMLMPLGVIPLITRKFSRLILVLPMVLINLMPDYYYQHDIGYQYTYGVAAMLFFLLVLNAADLRGQSRRGLLIFACCATILLGAMRAPLQIFYAQRYFTHTEDNTQISEYLQLIPDDASVRCSTMFSPHLSRRTELYLLNSKHSADYIALDLRPYVNAHIEGYDLEYFESFDYELIAYVDNLIAIFKTNP